MSWMFRWWSVQKVISNYKSQSSKTNGTYKFPKTCTSTNEKLTLEASQLICRTNQLTGFYMMETLVVKELIAHNWHSDTSQAFKVRAQDNLIC